MSIVTEILSFIVMSTLLVMWQDETLLVMWQDEMRHDRERKSRQENSRKKESETQKKRRNIASCENVRGRRSSGVGRNRGFVGHARH